MLSENTIDSSNCEQPTHSQSSIDKLTMEFMMNRTHYKKYLSMKEPVKFQENEIYIQKIKKYKMKIINIMSELVDDSTKLNVPEKYTRDINDTFQDFLKTCVKHFEIQELENNTDPNQEDMMFESCNEVSTEQVDDVNESSLWGKSVIKKHYTMDRFVSKK